MGINPTEEIKCRDGDITDTTLNPYPEFLCDYLLAFMFLRIVFLLRTFVNFGTYTDAYSRKLCRTEYGFTSGVRFTLKVHMVTNPGKSAFYIVSSSIMILSYLMQIFERPYREVNGKDSGAVDTFGDGFYLVVMTMTTVGYGDFSPHTIIG